MNRTTLYGSDSDKLEFFLGLDNGDFDWCRDEFDDIDYRRAQIFNAIICLDTVKKTVYDDLSEQGLDLINFDYRKEAISALRIVDDELSDTGFSVCEFGVLPYRDEISSYILCKLAKEQFGKNTIKKSLV